MIWKRPKHIIVQCSICSNQMESIERLPAVSNMGELSVYRCDECGNRRTVELPTTIKAA